MNGRKMKGGGGTGYEFKFIAKTNIPKIEIRSKGKRKGLARTWASGLLNYEGSKSDKKPSWCKHQQIDHQMILV